MDDSTINDEILKLLADESDFFSHQVSENVTATFSFVVLNKEGDKSCLYKNDFGSEYLIIERRRTRGQNIQPISFKVKFSSPLSCAVRSSVPVMKVLLTPNNGESSDFEFCFERVRRSGASTEDVKAKVPNNLLVNFKRKTLQSAEPTVYKVCYLLSQNQLTKKKVDKENLVIAPIEAIPISIGEKSSNPFIIEVFKPTVIRNQRPRVSKRRRDPVVPDFLKFHLKIEPTGDGDFSLFIKDPLLEALNIFTNCEKLDCTINVFKDLTRMIILPEEYKFTLFPILTEQLPPGDEIIWLNSNVPHSFIMSHLYQSAFFITSPETQSATLTIIPTLSSRTVKRKKEKNEELGDDVNKSTDSYFAYSDERTDSGDSSPGQKSAPDNYDSYVLEDIKAFLRACCKGDVKTVRQLLTAFENENPNQSFTGVSALYCALKFENLEVFKELLARGANPYEYQYNGDRPSDYDVTVLVYLEFFLGYLEKQLGESKSFSLKVSASNLDDYEDYTPEKIKIIENVLRRLLERSSSHFKSFFLSLSWKQICAFHFFVKEVLANDDKVILLHNFPEVLKDLKTIAILKDILYDYFDNLWYLNKFIKCLKVNEDLKFSEHKLIQHIFLSEFIEEFDKILNLDKLTIKLFELGQEIGDEGKLLYIKLPSKCNVKFLKKRLAMFSEKNIKKRAITISLQQKNLQHTVVPDYREISNDFDYLANYSTKIPLYFKHNLRTPCTIYCDLESQKSFTIGEMKKEIISQLTLFRQYQPEDLTLGFIDNQQELDNNKQVGDYLTMFKNRDNNSNNINLKVTEASPEESEKRKLISKPFDNWSPPKRNDHLSPRTSIDNPQYYRFFDADPDKKKNTKLDKYDRELLLRTHNRDFLPKCNSLLYDLKEILDQNYEDTGKLVDLCCRASQRGLPDLVYGYYNMSEQEYHEYTRIFKSPKGNYKFFLPAFLLTTQSPINYGNNLGKHGFDFNVVFKINLESGKRNGVVRLESSDGEPTTVFLLCALSYYEIISIRNEEIELRYLDALPFYQQSQIRRSEM